jgi:hypothetical protein
MNDIKEVYFRIRKSKEYNLLKNSILDETPCSTDDQSYVYLIIPKNLIFQMHYLVLSQSIHIMKLLLIMWSSKPVIQKNLIFLSFQNQYFIYLKN